MKILIIKTGAAGDVLRTTPLLRKYSNEEVDWFVGTENGSLLSKEYVSNIISSEQLLPKTKYDLVISLEDDPSIVSNVFRHIQYVDIFGTYLNASGNLVYTNDSREWFEMGVASAHGLAIADALKLANRDSYQEIIFRGLGLSFNSEEYVLPTLTRQTSLCGEIAVAPKAGNRWPSKNWFYFEEAMKLLSNRFTVNVLPARSTLQEHIADIQNHKLVLSGDSLPMHIGLGLKKKCVTLFFCTSPWEIYDYGRMEKIISPMLKDYFYTKEHIPELTRSITKKDVLKGIESMLFKT
jgi:heptosyltransferase II